jgi:outer membrane protein assembly factor BamB
MSMAGRARVLLPLVPVLLLLSAPTSPGRQPPPAPAAKDAEASAPAPEPVTPVTDPLVRRKLDAALDYLKVHSWGQAVRLLQGLLDSRDDSFLPRPGRQRGGPRWASVHAEAERLLAALPPAGKDVYRLNYEGAADRLLRAARAGADRATLLEVARRFRHTRAGAQALEILGGHYLDRGQAALAAACYRRLLDEPGAEPAAPLLLYQAALAFRGAADGDREAAAWAELGRQLRGGTLRQGGRNRTLEDLRHEADRLWPPPANPAGRIADEWLLYRGDPRRAALAQGSRFVLEPNHQIGTAPGESGEWLQRARRSSPPGTLPGAVPLAVEGKILFRTSFGVHALDALTGRQLWRTPSPLGLEGVLAEPGRKVQVQHWLDLYGPGRGLLLAGSTLGTLSSDGRLVYEIEDLALPPHPGLVQAQLQGETRSLGPLRHAAGHNRLRALDVATGQAAWEIGGPSPAPPPVRPVPPRGRGPSPAPRAARPPPRPAREAVLEDAFFLGPPLPLGGELLVLLDRQEDIQLVCLGARRGEVHWVQPLVVAGAKMLVDTARRTHAAHLAFADGILVCPTHCGAVVAVDPLCRRLLWAHVYREQPRPPAAEEEGATPRAGPAAWAGSAPILREGRVVFSAPDGEDICCLRLQDGGLLWKVPRGEEDLYVAGAFAEEVLVVGQRECRGLSLASGEVLWRQATGMPAGQGVAAGGVYFVPLADGAVFALDWKNPRASGRIEPRAPGVALGNLVFYRGVLWSQGIDSLTSFAPLQNRLSEVEARLARAPGDAAALAERGRLRLERGDLEGGTGDLQAALAAGLPEKERQAAQRRLFAAFNDLLERDFAVGEKHLDTLRSLCAEAPGADGGRPSEQERRQRGLYLCALVARGRHGQGRLEDALAACRDLLARARPGDLMAAPDDPGLRVSPRAWVRQQVAGLVDLPGDQPRRWLAEQMERHWRGSEGSKDEGERLTRFLDLFGAVPPLAGAAVSAPEARLRLAGHLAESTDPRDALRADLELSALAGSPAAPVSPIAARALAVQARLLTRVGLLDEAAGCYRRLGRDFTGTALDGRTGTEILCEARLDKRLLPSFESQEDSPQAAWSGRRIEASAQRPGPPADPLMLPCVGRQPFFPAVPGSLGTTDPPAHLDGWRFLVDGRALALVAVDRDTGRRLWSTPLPLQTLPAYLRGAELPCQVVDHLLLLAAGPQLLAVDLLDRRVRWVRDVTEGVTPAPASLSLLPDGGVQVDASESQLPRRLGWVGPAGRDGLCVQLAAGLTCLDPATGGVRWVRSGLSPWLTAFSDGDHLFLGEHQLEGAVRSLRAVRLADGRAVAIPEASSLYARRLRVINGRLLVSEEGPAGELSLRRVNVLTGKDDWARLFPGGSIVLSSPAADLLGVMDPESVVTVVDLAAGRSGPRLSLGPGQRARVMGGCLLGDGRHFYVAVQGQGEGSISVVGEPSPWFRGGLTATPANGLLYAFDRAGGRPRWYSRLPAQAILLERFDELPVIVCAAVSARTSGAPGNAEPVTAIRSIDKRTGKLLFHKEFRTPVEPFAALRIDRRGGVVDLVGPALVLRHRAAGAR